MSLAVDLDNDGRWGWFGGPSVDSAIPFHMKIVPVNLV
jgi:hypothetical protein